MYDYNIEKPRIYTDQGIATLLKIRDRFAHHFETSGSVKLINVINDITGSNWFHIACVEYLAEIGDIIEITNKEKCATQDRVFVKRL